MEQKNNSLKQNIIGIDCGFSPNSNIFVMYMHKDKHCCFHLNNVCSSEVKRFSEGQKNLSEKDMMSRIESFMRLNFGDDDSIKQKIFVMEKCVKEWTNKIPAKSILRREEYKDVAKFCIAMQKAFIKLYSSQILYVEHFDTSNICSNCSFKNKENARNLANTSGKKTFRCLRCEYECNRDINAAKNIYFRGVEKLIKTGEFNFIVY